MSCGTDRAGYTRQYATRHFTDGKGNYVTMHTDSDNWFFFTFDEAGETNTGWQVPEYGSDSYAKLTAEQIAESGLIEHADANTAREAAAKEKGGEEASEPEEQVEDIDPDDVEDLVLAGTSTR